MSKYKIDVGGDGLLIAEKIAKSRALFKAVAHEQRGQKVSESQQELWVQDNYKDVLENGAYQYEIAEARGELYFTVTTPVITHCI